MGLLVLMLLARDCFLTCRLRGVPGPWAIPIIGHIPFLLSEPWFKFSRWAQVYGEVYKM